MRPANYCRDDRRIAWKLQDIKKAMKYLSRKAKNTTAPSRSNTQRELLRRRNYLIVQFHMVKNSMVDPHKHKERVSIYDI